MKTYYIRQEDCKDEGDYYSHPGGHYDGNLIVQKMDKPLRVYGDQTVKGNQRVEGDQIVKGYQYVKYKSISSTCRHLIQYSKTTIKIGCKEKATQEWREWFAGTEEYQTPRTSPMFKQIYKVFLMAEVAQLHDPGLAE